VTALKFCSGMIDFLILDVIVAESPSIMLGASRISWS